MPNAKKKDSAEAPAVSEASNSEQPGTYKENPDKPGPDSVAQVQVLPDEK